MDRVFASSFQQPRLTLFTAIRQAHADHIAMHEFACGTFRTSRVAIAMSVGGGRADLAYGRIGAFLFAPLIAHEVEFYAFACLVSG